MCQHHLEEEDPVVLSRKDLAGQVRQLIQGQLLRSWPNFRERDRDDRPTTHRRSLTRSLSGPVGTAPPALVPVSRWRCRRCSRTGLLARPRPTSCRERLTSLLAPSSLGTRPCLAGAVLTPCQERSVLTDRQWRMLRLRQVRDQ